MTQNDNAAVEALYQKTFGTLLGAISDTPDLLARQAKTIVEGLRGQLHHYDGDPADELGFALWALSAMMPSSRVLVLLTNYRKFIYKGYWAILHSCEDLIEPNTFDELDSDLVCWLLTNMDSLTFPNEKRKMSTILYSRAYWTARTWKTIRLRNRAKTANLDDINEALEREADLRGQGKIPYQVHRDTLLESFEDAEIENNSMELAISCP